MARKPAEDQEQIEVWAASQAFGASAMIKGNMSSPAIVYLAVNKINGKKYIGITSRSIKDRKREHRCHAMKGVNQGAFYRAIRKYGIKVFEFTTLVQCASVYEALEQEMRLIAELQPEYNSTEGGDGQRGRTMSEESRKRISEFHKGKSWHLGRKHSEDVKQLLREAQSKPDAIERWKIFSEMGPRALARQVVCLDDGKCFESASSAARFYGVCKSAVIEICLKKPYRKSIGGYRFAYAGVS